MAAPVIEALWQLAKAVVQLAFWGLVAVLIAGIAVELVLAFVSS